MALEKAGKCRWYDGIMESLTKLRDDGCTLVILSNCRTHHAKGHWEAFDMGRWFSEFYDCQSFGYAPKTEIIKTVMAQQPGPYVMVGDRRADRDCAQAGHMPFIGCGYGYGTPGELDGADIIINSGWELADAAEKLLENA